MCWIRDEPALDVCAVLRTDAAAGMSHRVCAVLCMQLSTRLQYVPHPFVTHRLLTPSAHAGYGRTRHLPYVDNNMRAELLKAALEFAQQGSNLTAILVTPSMSGWVLRPTCQILRSK